jgi:putative peptidoglycan lipid II flippase
MAYKATGQHGRASELFAWSCLLAGMALVFLFVFGSLFPRFMVGASTPGFEGGRLAEGARMLPWCLLTMVLVGLSDLMASWYQLHRRFLPTALVPAGCLVLSIGYLILFRHHGPMALVHGSAVAGAVQLGMMLLLARRQGFWRWRWPGRPASDFFLLLLSTGKMILILLTAYFAPLIDVVLTSFLPRGSLSTMEFSVRLHDVVVRLGVVSLATALFPVMGHLAANDRHHELLSEVRRCSLVSFLLFVPLGIGILLFGPYAVGAVFQRGRFNAIDTEMVSLIWGLYSLGLCSTAGVHVTARALQACQQYRTALGIGTILILVHGTVGWFAVMHLGLAGLPLASLVSQSVAYVVSYCALVRLRMSRSPNPKAMSPFGGSAVRSYLCLLLCILGLWAVSVGIESTSLSWRVTVADDLVVRIANAVKLATALILLMILYGYAILRLGTPGFRGIGRRLGLLRPLSG